MDKIQDKLEFIEEQLDQNELQLLSLSNFLGQLDCQPDPQQIREGLNQMSKQLLTSVSENDTSLDLLDQILLQVQNDHIIANKEFSQVIEIYKTNLNKKQIETAHLTRLQNDLQKQLDDLQTETALKQAELQSENKMLQSSNAQLENSLQQRLVEIRNLQNNMAKQHDSIAQLSQNTLQQKLEEQKQQLFKLQNELKRSQMTELQLQNDLEDAQQKLAQQKDFQKDFLAAKKQVDLLVFSNLKLENEIKSLRTAQNPTSGNVDQKVDRQSEAFQTEQTDLTSMGCQTDDLTLNKEEIKYISIQTCF